MSLPVAHASTHDALLGGAAVADATTIASDERWSAWRARGAAQDQSVRRRMMVVSGVIVTAAAVGSALLLGWG